MSRLDRLLRPKSIAVIGGGFFTPNVVKQMPQDGLCRRHLAGPPREGRGGGRAAPSARSPTCRARRTRPSSASTATSPSTCCKALRERGAGGAICFAAGFRETAHYDPDGSRLQDALIEAAGDMPIIGPNCYGLINYADGALLWPDQHGGRRLKEGETGAAIITQSSNIACNLTMQTRGLPLAFLMTAGNQAQTGISEMALGLIEDPARFVARPAYRGLRFRRRLRAAGGARAGVEEADRRDEGRPLRAGAGGNGLAYGLARRLRRGFGRFPEAPRHCARRHHSVLPRDAEALPRAWVRWTSYTLSSMSCSGGEASVMADAAEGRPVFFPALTDEHRARVEGDARAAGRRRQSARLQHLYLGQGGGA